MGTPQSRSEVAVLPLDALAKRKTPSSLSNLEQGSKRLHVSETTTTSLALPSDSVPPQAALRALLTDTRGSGEQDKDVRLICQIGNSKSGQLIATLKLAPVIRTWKAQNSTPSRYSLKVCRKRAYPSPGQCWAAESARHANNYADEDGYVQSRGFPTTRTNIGPAPQARMVPLPSVSTSDEGISINHFNTNQVREGAGSSHGEHRSPHPPFPSLSSPSPQQRQVVPSVGTHCVSKLCGSYRPGFWFTPLNYSKSVQAKRCFACRALSRSGAPKPEDLDEHAMAYYHERIVPRLNEFKWIEPDADVDEIRKVIVDRLNLYTDDYAFNHKIDRYNYYPELSGEEDDQENEENEDYADTENSTRSSSQSLYSPEPEKLEYDSHGTVETVKEESPSTPQFAESNTCPKDIEHIDLTSRSPTPTGIQTQKADNITHAVHTQKLPRSSTMGRGSDGNTIRKPASPRSTSVALFVRSNVVRVTPSAISGASPSKNKLGNNGNADRTSIMQAAADTSTVADSHASPKFTPQSTLGNSPQERSGIPLASILSPVPAPRINTSITAQAAAATSTPPATPQASSFKQKQDLVRLVQIYANLSTKFDSPAGQKLLQYFPAQSLLAKAERFDTRLDELIQQSEQDQRQVDEANRRYEELRKQQEESEQRVEEARRKAEANRLRAFEMMD